MQDDSEMNVTQLITLASLAVDKTFETTKTICPLVHCINEEGQHEIFHIPLYVAKEDSLAYIAAALQVMRAVSYVFINECWAVSISTADKTPDQIREIMDRYAAMGIENFPEREACVLFAAEDMHGAATGYRTVFRPKGKPPYLGELKIKNTEESMFMGLLYKPNQSVN